ncbi:putative mRNA cap guanine-N7 methyltransferase [Mollisia scopiformis]|uniref:mRNA cap guanine-N(7) methyltransferase n=1 Tax=Mollisia scopiformis TaxID=149040 RepID=A0A194WXF9_MOLSC|nr:putative mRNA cap guanine-N7 methyltransferase [Mollisia scopiformis]KUJ12272.1 putative mRNA cap guanine-N7 methyltransferase [Mollisia scopiformis]
MAGDAAGISPVDEQPQPFNATKLEPAKKRKRSRSPSTSTPRRLDPRSDSKRRSTSPSNPAKRQRSPSPQPRKQKRPGQRARITDAEREQIRQKQIEREKELEAAVAKQGIHDAVKQHYNTVPERGRDWRKTESRIKGLRSFNNWVKSTIIQKFSPSEDYTPGAQERGGMVFAEGPTETKGLLVLDIGCGKGGDLGKWQQAPQPVELYVGLDPADISIDQAKDRYRQMSSRGGGGRGRGGRGGYNGRPQPRLFQGEFFVQDCFGDTIEKVPLVRDVGFDGSGGPSRFGGGGFDVVSMMFCMHYAFESEEKARRMLKNVAGALKKGGRFIGTIPNSDILTGKVKDFNDRMASKKKQAGPAEDNEEGEEKEDDGEVEEGEAEETAGWGNEIYKVRFPGETPADGIFRPPYGWKYNFFLHEAVEEVPEYVVPWEAFRALAEDYNLEMQYHAPFDQIWKTDKDDETLGPLSERMGVRARGQGRLLVSDEEMEAASFYVAFCFYKV